LQAGAKRQVLFFATDWKSTERSPGEKLRAVQWQQAKGFVHVHQSLKISANFAVLRFKFVEHDLQKNA
jgi:hypothetical protein